MKRERARAVRSRWGPRQAIGDANDPRGFEATIARYLEWREARQYSQSHRHSIESVLRRFAFYCVERGVIRPQEVTRPILERYQHHLFQYRRANGHPLAATTQRTELNGISTFFRWLVRERYLLYNPAADLELPKKPVRLPVDTFSLDEVEQILATPCVAEPLGLRDRALLELLYSTGLRRAEVAALDVFDVQFDRGCVTVRAGKGKKDRVVPIGERGLAWVRRYLDHVRPQLLPRPEEWALFLTADGERFSTDSLGNSVRAILEASGVRKRAGCCHLFRHTMATMMLEGGADLRYVQEMLGHAKLDTTQIYTRVAITKLKEIHTATHPGAKLERRPDLFEEDPLAPS